MTRARHHTILFRILGNSNGFVKSVGYYWGMTKSWLVKQAKKAGFNALKAGTVALGVGGAMASFSQTHNDFHYNENGHARGSLDYAFDILHANAPEDQKRFYNVAAQGGNDKVHSLFPLLIMTTEIGLRPFYGDTKSAQGYYQNESLWLIENCQKYCRDTEFYKDLNDNDPIKWAIDSILNDPDMRDPTTRKARSIKMDRSFATGLYDETTMDMEFLDLRLNEDFATQLMNQKIYVECEACRTENLPDDANEALAIIYEEYGRFYSRHLKGDNGSRYLYALAEAAPELRIEQTVEVQQIANRLQEENGWIYGFNAEEWKINTEANRGPFRDGAQTRLGDIPRHFAEYVSLKSSLVTVPLTTIITIADAESGQSFENYFLNGDAFNSLNQPTEVTESKRPQAHPARPNTDGIVTIENDGGYTMRPTARRTPSPNNG